MNTSYVTTVVQNWGLGIPRRGQEELWEEKHFLLSFPRRGYMSYNVLRYLRLKCLFFHSFAGCRILGRKIIVAQDSHLESV